MLSITDRYLIREVMAALTATVVVLLAIVLASRLAQYLSQAAAGAMPREVIFWLLGLQAVQILSVLVPVGLLLGCLLALGRLYRDSEMTALTACGFGPRAVYRPLLLLALPLALVSAGLSLYGVPKAMDLRNELRDQARREAEVSLFSPGTFREVAGGDYVVYAQTLSDQGRQMSGVFIQNPLEEGRVAITTGARGHLEVDPDSGARYMVLDDGYRFEGRPGGGDYQNARFQTLRVRVDTPAAEENYQRREAMSSLDLWQRGRAVDWAELHARVSGPVSLVLIAFLGPLLARTGPRQGRYGRLVAGVLIYAVYLNLLGVGQAWVEHEVVPVVVGLWWVHGLLGLVILGLWWQQRRTSRPRRMVS